MSPEPFPQPSARMLYRSVLVILWGVTFLAVHWLTFLLYFVPLLALITFSGLAPFPVIVAGLFLTGYVDIFPADQAPATLKLLLIGTIWLAALGARIAAWRYRAADKRPDEVIPPASSPLESSVLPDAKPSAVFRHDVRTPLALILSFCEALLGPAPAGRQALPVSLREDVEAIYRNGQQLQPLVEKLLALAAERPAEERTAVPEETQPRKAVIILDEGGAAFELLSQYVQGYDLIRAVSVEAVGRLEQDSDPLAVVIHSDDYTLIPVVAQLVGDSVPILTFNLADAQPRSPFHGASGYLVKPVVFEALMSALDQTGGPHQRVLIIDDNRDSMQMMSRMLNSMAEPPQLLKAYSGREALALLREEIPDVILLDFVLPDMDGLAMLDYLRSESRLARIPVVLVSAHHPPDVFPAPGVTRLTLFRLAGFSPADLARHLEGLLDTFGKQG